MNRLLNAVLFVFAVFSFCSIVSADGSDASSGGILITEVSPADEAVCLENTGLSRVNLNGYSVTDGEGTVTFTSDYFLEAGSKVVVSKETGTDWFNSRSYVLTFSSGPLAKSGNFTLANSGDEVSLSRDSTLLDSVCYGSSSGTGGWSGSPVAISSGQYLLRTGKSDTDTSSDWTSTRPGWTNLTFSEEQGFSSIVTPFTFPESRGEPVLTALSEAVGTIDVSIYLVSSPAVVSLLCQKEESGVEVRVLVEGNPLGVDISTELSLLRSLVDSGGDVRLINYSGSSDARYSYVHNKYAVIDASTVVITSENWTSGNIGDYGNRGWGAVIESCGYASYMESVFENDFSTEWGDVGVLSDVYPNCRPYAGLPAVEQALHEYASYAAYVTPVLSPDNSFEALEKTIAGAETRVYAEQMDLGSDLYQTKGETPLSWMSQASSRGVDARFILDSSQSDGSTHETYVNSITNSSTVKAVAVNGGEGFSLIHNKGLIVDDCVWVGSVNWTDTSFVRNRESAVLIESCEVSDYFSDFFLEDFGVNIFTVEEDGLGLTVSIVESSQGPLVLMSVDGPSGYEYMWELGDGQTRTSTNNVALFPAPSAGIYSASVSMLENGLVESVSYSVDGSGSGSYDSLIAYSSACAALVLCLGIAVAVVRERRSFDPMAGRDVRRPGRFR